MERPESNIISFIGKHLNFGSYPDEILADICLSIYSEEDIIYARNIVVDAFGEEIDYSKPRPTETHDIREDLHHIFFYLKLFPCAVGQEQEYTEAIEKRALLVRLDGMSQFVTGLCSALTLSSEVSQSQAIMSSESDPQPQSSSQSDNQSNEQNDAQDTISRPILESPNNLVHPVPIPTNEMPRGPAVHANIIYGPSAEIRLDGIRFDVPINVGGMEDFTLEVPVAQPSADPIPDVVPHASVTESAASAPVDPEPGASSSSGQAPKALPNLVPIVTLEETMILNDPSEDDLSSAINSGSTSTSDTGSSSWVETVPLSFVTGPKGSQDITAHIEPSRPPIQAVPAPPATSSMPPPSSPPATSTAPATSSASAMSPASGSSPALALSSPSSPPSVKKGAAGRNKLGSKPSSPKRRKRPKKDPSN